MKVTPINTVVRADQIKAGDTFKYIPKCADDYMDFLVIGSNSCFRVLKNIGLERVDGVGKVMVYNIGAKCWGVVPAATKVIPTNAELLLNG